MNSQSNVISDFPSETRAAAPATIPVAQLFYWSIRRELWENRALYVAPLAVASVVLLGFLVGMFHLRRHMDVSAFSLGEKQMLFQQPYHFAALVIMGVTFVISFFYSLDALYGERRDRSILFWKSLPVSDLTTVLSKMAIPLIAIPVVTFAVTLLLQACMLFGVTLIFFGTGLVPSSLSAHILLQSSLMLLYHLFAIHSLWYAPVYAWLLLVSAWARRTPFLWAVLPPFGLAVVEKIAFRTDYVTSILKNRFAGAPGSASFSAAGTSMTNGLTAAPSLPLAQFFSSPGLWLGLLVAAAFLAGAVALRRQRDPI